MKTNIKLLISSSILGISLFSLINLNRNNVKESKGYSVSSVPTTIDLNDTSSSNIRSYYSSLNNLSQSERQGTNLLKNLKPILKNNQKYLSYGSGPTTAVWRAYEIVDRDWTKSPANEIDGYNAQTNTITGYVYGSSVNGDKGTNPYIHALYVNRDVENLTRAWDDHQQTQWGFNQEHIWAKSCGFEDTVSTGGARGDLMHLWAGNGRVNGDTHSNYYYGYVDTTKSYNDAGTYASTLSGNRRGTSRSLGGSVTVFEPQDCDKGDIARAIFYMAARYNYYSGSDSDGIDACNPNLELVNNVTSWENSGYQSSTSITGKMGILQDLLEWNRLDPPDAWEIHRNNLLYNNFTNNRNPFIDFPEWAEFIWGKSVSGNYSSSSTGYATPSSDVINYFDDGLTPFKTLSSISVSGQTTSFTVGDTFTFGGTVTATYDDSTTANVTNSSTFSGYNMSTSGNQTVTVSYTEGGVNKTTTYSITVNEDSGESSDIAGDYILYSGNITEGNYVISYSNGALKNTVSNSRFDYSSVTPSNNTITNPDASIVWHIAPSGDYWTIYNEDAQKYAGSTSNRNQGALLENVSDNAKWTVTGNSTYEFENLARSTGTDSSNKWLRKNTTYGFACYSSSTGGGLTLYKQEITVPTSISASVDKTYYVGETITKSDITVTDNLGNDIDDFTFSENGYQFQYSDTNSGGSPKTKSFTITYDELETTLEVSVRRKAHIAPNSDTLNKASTGNPSGYTAWDSVNGSGGAVYAGYSSGTYDSIQLRSSASKDGSYSGIITTSNSGKPLISVSVTWEGNTLSGRTLQVYGSNSAYSSPNDLFSNQTSGTLLGTIVKGTSTRLVVSGTYQYFGVRSSSDAMYLTDITFVTGDNTITNLSNYIMYEDTTNQCNSKYSVAKGYFNDLSTSDRNTFMTSNDYVIATARNRLEAWARNKGEEIIHINGDYSFSSVAHSFSVVNDDNQLVIIIASISTISLLGLLFFLKKKKN